MRVYDNFTGYSRPMKATENAINHSIYNTVLRRRTDYNPNPITDVFT